MIELWLSEQMSWGIVQRPVRRARVAMWDGTDPHHKLCLSWDRDRDLKDPLAQGQMIQFFSFPSLTRFLSAS
jgi:hypothetical protein